MCLQKTRQERILERIKNFSLFDDEFAEKVFEDNIDAIQLVLNIILNRNDLKVLEAQV